MKNNNNFFFTSQNLNPRHKHAKWPPSDLTPWTLTLHQGYHEDENCETEESLTTNQALQATGVLKFEKTKIQVRTHCLFSLGLANSS